MYADNTKGGTTGKRFDQYSPEEREIIHKKSCETRKKNNRKRKALKELLEVALSMRDDSGERTDERIIAALVNNALRGDNKAFELIRDQLGEQPAQKVEVANNIIKVNIDGDTTEPEEELIQQ